MPFINAMLIFSYQELIQSFVHDSGARWQSLSHREKRPTVAMNGTEQGHKIVQAKVNKVNAELSLDIEVTLFLKGLKLNKNSDAMPDLKSSEIRSNKYFIYFRILT